MSEQSPGRGRGLESVLAGAAGGLIASIPMAAVMLLLYKTLPGRREGYPLPPEQITTRLAKRAHMEDAVDERGQRRAATWAGHLGYGAAAGSLFPLIFNRMSLPLWLKGSLFGIAVWAGSYMGWLPAAHILPSASHQPARRNALMIISHLVWGNLLAIISDSITQTTKENGYVRS